MKKIKKKGKVEDMGMTIRPRGKHETDQEWLDYLESVRAYSLKWGGGSWWPSIIATIVFILVLLMSSTTL